MIPAFLRGVRDAVAGYTGKDTVTGIQPGNDGAPRFEYKGGGWYFGIYFSGMSGGSANGAGDVTGTLAVSIDVTRCIQKIPSGKQGEWIAKPDELLDMAGRIAKFLLNPDYKVANACNAALAQLSTDPNGKFYDHFDTFTISAVQDKGCEWIGASPDDNKCPGILVCTISLAGLSYTQTVEALPSWPT